MPESQADSDSSEDEADEKPNIVTLPPTGVDSVNLEGSSQSMSRQSSLSSVSSSPQKTPFRSLISTRGQKAREESLSSISHLQTPPKSGSSSDSATHNSARALRNRKSEPIPPPRDSSSTVAPRPRGRPRKVLDSSSTAAHGSGKQADGESHFLRARKSLPAVILKKGDTPTPAAVTKKAVPSVPTCATCSTPLPPPPVAERSPRKGKSKEVKEECARCKRHFLIFNAAWPQRTPNPGSSFIPTPRESTPAECSQRRVSHSNLPGLDKKLKAIDNTHKRVREEESASIVSKKRKITPPEVAVQQGGSRVGRRKRVPSLKARESSGPIIKSEFSETVSLSGVLDLKRSGSRQKRSREVDTVDSHVAQQSISEGLKSKRGRRSAPEVVEAERVEDNVIVDADDRRDKSFWPCLPLPPNGLGVKHLGLLNVRPNPCSISRWRSSYGSFESTPTLVDDDTDDNASDIHPSTPPDNGVNDDIVVDSIAEVSTTYPLGTPEVPPESDSESEVVEKIPPPKLTVSTIGLFSKPNPVELARRIWAPLTPTVDSAEDDPRTPQRRSNLSNALSSPESAKVLRTKLGPPLTLHPKRIPSTNFPAQGDSGTSSGEDVS
ncbi:hypothetical protein SCHPADRAFT_2227 [Schizopora paradoxa]|uniref:Uncharacterized protein n=1 Tax=Schizopora paradoxa TaxID=27342 RepID=A0A0H2S906_9AGAM|nr:hypothetical protein SCHPADRAFT_2227 [Schizopora paradoxa]